jgi:glutamyl-Q tRNA(Asp) synthetase
MSSDSRFPTVTRFAPSPTGLLHLGHAYSALFAMGQAEQTGGRFLLRIEDIDPERCRTEFEEAIYEDLSWLGLNWEAPVRRQSEHMDEYAKALSTLHEIEILYPCFCTRKDIQSAIHTRHHADLGPDGPLYPGTCRGLSQNERKTRESAGDAFALRLDMDKALTGLSSSLQWNDLAHGKITATPEIFGDVVLARKNTPTSYHLAVTLDDHLQGITLVTRGEDLLSSTHVHRLLQELLGLRTPDYHHHPLLTDSEGRRYAKRDKSLSLKALKDEGKSPEQVRQMAGLE